MLAIAYNAIGQVVVVQRPPVESGNFLGLNNNRRTKGMAQVDVIRESIRLNNPKIQQLDREIAQNQALLNSYKTEMAQLSQTIALKKLKSLPYSIEQQKLNQCESKSGVPSRKVESLSKEREIIMAAWVSHYTSNKMAVR